MNYPEIARNLVFKHISRRLEPSDAHVDFALSDVYVVSFFFVLGGWKALISTTLPDGMYYEVTYNPDKAETYITAYKQWEHVTIPDTKESPY